MTINMWRARSLTWNYVSNNPRGRLPACWGEFLLTFSCRNLCEWFLVCLILMKHCNFFATCPPCIPKMNCFWWFWIYGLVGFPILGIEWQKMENPDLRKALGMKPNQKGVRIRRVEPTAPAAKQLQSSDILLGFDDIDIANDGTGGLFFLWIPSLPVMFRSSYLVRKGDLRL